MLSYLEMDEGEVVPLHDHPHEQGGILLEGQVELTIGDEVRVCEVGEMFLIPPNTPHKAVAVGGPARVLDVFSPVREDYAELYRSMKNELSLNLTHVKTSMPPHQTDSQRARALLRLRTSELPQSHLVSV